MPKTRKLLAASYSNDHTKVQKLSQSANDVTMRLKLRLSMNIKARIRLPVSLERFHFSRRTLDAKIEKQELPTSIYGVHSIKFLKHRQKLVVYRDTISDLRKLNINSTK